MVSTKRSYIWETTNWLKRVGVKYLELFTGDDGTAYRAVKAESLRLLKRDLVVGLFVLIQKAVLEHLTSRL